MNIVTDTSFPRTKYELHITLGEMLESYVQYDLRYCCSFIERLIANHVGQMVYVPDLMNQFHKLAPNVIVYADAPIFETAVDEAVSVDYRNFNNRRNYRIALFEFLIAEYGADTEMVFTAIELNY